MKNPVSVSGLTPLEVLGLGPSASPEEVRGSFRLLAKVLHPDVLPRGAGLFKVLQAAQDAALVRNAWVAPPPMAGGFTREFPPVPTAPPAPVRRPEWRQNKKGGYSRKEGAEWVNVYAKGAGWKWAGPSPNGGTEFCNEVFDGPMDAMEDADAFYEPSGGWK